MMIKDSGNRREFNTGAVRDIQEGKGRCDLLPLDSIVVLIADTGEYKIAEIFDEINKFVRFGEVDGLASALLTFFEYRGWSLPEAILEVSIHYEEGCTKYGEHNWEKGIPLHSFIDSGIRHLLKVLAKYNDERHDRAFAWNMLGAIWTFKNRPDMIDIQFEPIPNDIESDDEK